MKITRISNADHENVDPRAISSKMLDSLTSLEIELPTGARFLIQVGSLQHRDDALKVRMTHPGHIYVPTTAAAGDGSGTLLKPLIVGE